MGSFLQRERQFLSGAVVPGSVGERPGLVACSQAAVKSGQRRTGGLKRGLPMGWFREISD